MARKKTHTPPKTPRVPSNVPNDYGHLGVPGSLNMSLNDNRRRRAHARRRRRVPNWFKAVLALGGIGMLVGVVLLVFGIMLYPSYYRGLKPSERAAWDSRWDRLGGLLGQDELGKNIREKIVTPVPTYLSIDLQGMTSPEEIQARQTQWALTPLAQTQTFETQTDAIQATQTVEAFRQLPPADQAATLAVFPEATYWMPADGGQAPTPDPALPQTAPPTPSPTAGGGLPVGMAGSPTPTNVMQAPGVSPMPTMTPLPTPLPVLPPPTPAPTIYIPPTEVPIPPTARLDGIRYESQDWNNCGPTTMTMALSYFGWGENQYAAAKWMKPQTEDKNVSPWQMVQFVNDNTNLRALWRLGGTTHVVKSLIAAGFPVVIEEGFQPAGEDWMGHYLLLMGYDDYNQHFLAFDSYLGNNQGQGREHPYVLLDQNWRHFNRVFMVVYRSDMESKLREALGQYVDPTYGFQVALDTARAEVAKDGEDKWAWFNMGTAYDALGDYQNAAIAFDRAHQLYLPWRMLWYQFGPYEAYYRVGRYEDVLTLANTNKNITPYVEEIYYWQGMVYAAQGDSNTAINRFNEALRYNKNYFPAQEAKAQVEAGTFTSPSVASVGP